MKYYLSAYVIFWTALSLYLGWLTARQAWLNRRAAGLVDRLASRAEPRSSSPEGVS